MLKLRSKKLEKIVLGTETKPAEVINYLNCHYIFNHPLPRWPKKPVVVIFESLDVGYAITPHTLRMVCVMSEPQSNRE
jgi:hypothetical protein